MNKKTGKPEMLFDKFLNFIANMVTGSLALIRLFMLLAVGVLLFIGGRFLVIFLLDTVGDAVFEWIISSPRILWGSMGLFGMFLMYLFIRCLPDIINFLADIEPFDWFMFSGEKF